MIPIRDSIPSRTYPFVTVALIVVNAVVFLYELSLGTQLEEFIRTFAVVPMRYSAAVQAGQTTAIFIYPQLWVPLLTSMFMHGGWLHLIGNMLYLWVFGDNVEDRMGHFRYLLFYLLCGLAATAAHILTNSDSPIPSLGASGAIAGVLGAYLILYPRARVLVLLPVFIFLQFFEVPALLFLLFWFLQQFVAGALSLGVESAQSSGVAWWAHIGGFVAGVLMVFIFKKPNHRHADRDVIWDRWQNNRRYIYHDPYQDRNRWP
ncbi:MAG: rhomboid family intramembrane serine protease [Blastocatellia bacterium]|nr:rhomboid family intramembrane serine protease [Blastocatellia bacterium]